MDSAEPKSLISLDASSLNSWSRLDVENGCVGEAFFILITTCTDAASRMSTNLVLCVQVKVILGEDREATGILLSIDGDDGIVRMELDDQLKILNLRFLGRLEH